MSDKKYDVICACLNSRNTNPADHGSKIQLDFDTVGYTVVLDASIGMYCDYNTGVYYHCTADGQGNFEWSLGNIFHLTPPIVGPVGGGLGSLLAGIDHLTAPPPPVTYGATCQKCNGYNPDAEAVVGFTCYGCRA